MVAILFRLHYAELKESLLLQDDRFAKCASPQYASSRESDLFGSLLLVWGSVCT